MSSKAAIGAPRDLSLVLKDFGHCQRKPVAGEATVAAIIFKWNSAGVHFKLLGEGTIWLDV